MIQLKSIQVTFGKNTPLENRVLRDLSLQVNPGEWVTVVGGNGAGKSTLMGVLSGEIKPDSGSVLIDGLDITDRSSIERAQWISRVFQDPMLGTCADLTLEQNMALAFCRDRKRNLRLALKPSLRSEMRELLANLGLGLENRIGDRIGVLSGGQRQAVSLLMATFKPSKLLLLDEHTAALDPKMAEKVIEITARIIDEQKLTAIMITHNLSQALTLGTRTWIMNQGSISADLTGETRKNLTPINLMSSMSSH